MILDTDRRPTEDLSTKLFAAEKRIYELVKHKKRVRLLVKMQMRTAMQKNRALEKRLQRR